MKIHIPKFLKKKRNIWIIAIIVVLIIAGWFIFGRGKANNSIQTGFVTKQNLEATVLTTGQVVSSTDLDLSFQGSGVVRKVLVKEGDKVYQGQLLAYLDQSSALASLTTAQGSFGQAKANYDKLLAGASAENIQTVQDSVAGAKQDLNNIYNGAVNTLNSAYTAMFNAYTVSVSITNTYFSSVDQQGIAATDSKTDINDNMQKVKNFDNSDSAISQMIFALNNTFNDLSIIRQQCELGIYYSKVSATDKTSLDTQKANINTSLASVTTLQHNIASYKIALQKAEDQLALTKAPPTQAEIDLAKAQMLSAQGQVDSAMAVLRNLSIVAPSSGIITQIDKKVGEQATATTEVMILQDVGNLYAEADVSEANIASLEIGQSIDYTFDALGPDQHFSGKVLTINPSSTVVSGVVNYKVKGSLDNVPKIKPGMTANMTILTAEKKDALAVPSTAVINKNNKNYVRVIDNSKTKTYHEVEAKIGLQADGGLVEILSGLNNGQEIITYLKP